MITLQFPDGWQCPVKDLGPRRITGRINADETALVDSLEFDYHTERKYRDLTIADLDRAIEEANRVECWNRAVVEAAGIFLSKLDGPRANDVVWEVMAESLKSPIIKVTHREGE